MARWKMLQRSILIIYLRIINKIKNKEEVYSILVMAENMQVLGLMVNNVVLDYIIRIKINIKLEYGIMDKE